MEGTPFFSFDDSKLYSYELNEVKNPRGVVQIIHGMAEHAGRYEAIANFLNRAGFIDYLSEHIGHGRTALSIDKIGKYDGDIFYDTIKDQIFISEYLLDKYNLPLIVIGHSFGSFIAQRYNELYKKHSALVLIGSGYLKNDPSILLGKLVAKLGVKIKGKDVPAKFINNLTFKQYNKKFVDKNWLTSDKQEQQKQRIDRYCNRIFSYNFYKYFFGGISDIYKAKNVAQINTSIPMLLLSGGKDALNKAGEGIKKLQTFYKENAVDVVDLKIYEKARHEVLNEVNKNAVYADLLKFIETNVKLEENRKKEKK